MRVLALDWGTVRIGAAISDEEGKIAFPLKKPLESKLAITEIKKLTEENQIDLILLGLPKTLAGEEGKSAQHLKIFAGQLHDQLKIPVSFIDERFTSVAAGNVLKDQGLSEREQREIKDNIAAQLMLQQYLDTKNN